MRGRVESILCNGCLTTDALEVVAEGAENTSGNSSYYIYITDATIPYSTMFLNIITDA